MHLINNDSDALLRKALSECYEAQQYAKPLIDKSKFERGVRFERKLSALMNLVSEKTNCSALRSELESLDDLVYQLKYISMEPMLKTMEDIESNVNRFLNSLPSGSQILDPVTGMVIEETYDQAEVSKDDSQKDGHDFTIDDASTDHDSFGCFNDDSSVDNSSTEASEDMSHSDATEKTHDHDAFTPFDAIIEEPSEAESAEENGENIDYNDSERRVSIPEALNASQATIDGLLDALDGSGDTLDLLQATLERKERDTMKCHSTLDSEVNEAQKVLDTDDEITTPDEAVQKGALHDADKATNIEFETGVEEGSASVDISTIGSNEAEDAAARQNALLNGHQAKFFDRLNHLFEVRKKVEQRMKRIDPGRKLKEIEIVTHSNGIREENGSFKTKYQQQDVNGRVARNLGDVYAAAKQAQSCFLDLIYRMCDKVKLGHFDAFFSPLKPRDRASEKAKLDYSHRFPGSSETWLYDILRVSITCKTVKQMESINKFLSKKAHIVQAKNRFVDPTYNGYRDLLYHVRMRYEFKENVFFIAEIQVELKEVIAVQSLFGLNAHLLYFRPCFSGPGRSMEKTLQSLERLRKAGKVDSRFVDDLLKSEDSDQLGMFAQLFHEKLECFDEALELYGRILTLEKCNVGERHAKTAMTYQNAGLVQCKKGDFDGAMMNLQKALEIQEAVFGSYHPEVATTRSRLGHVMCLRGDETSSHQGALQQHRSSLAIRTEALGDDHVDVATSYQNIGLSLGQLGDLDGSLSAYREALTILKNVLGSDHLNVADTHSMIGTVLCRQEAFGEALQEFTHALKIRTDVLGKTHPATADSQTEIGHMLCQTGDCEKALWKYKETLRIRRAALGRDHPDCATSLSNIGYVLNQLGDYEGALVQHRQALGIRDAILGKRHPESLASRQSIKASLQREREM